ncbi:hypothetical protein LJC47_03310 [Desulfosarcina sp. OttesenSCG-928-B08]|nr:hypothetical protein [Desulfosarcina sp. OttesenSCG-928-B08]
MLFRAHSLEIQNLALRDLLDETGTGDTVTDSADVDINRLLPLMNFLRAEKSPDTVYETDDVLDMAAAFHTFSVKTDLSRLIDYTVDENIPAVFRYYCQCWTK